MTFFPPKEEGHSLFLNSTIQSSYGGQMKDSLDNASMFGYHIVALNVMP